MERTAWILAPVALFCSMVGCNQSDQPAVTSSDSSNAPVADSSAAPSGDSSLPATQYAPGETPDTSNISPTELNPPLPQIAANATPEEVVSAFLNSLCIGNELMTAGLLTDIARQETAKYGLTIQPIGSPQATYEVQEAVYLANQPEGAHVNSVWTERDENGEPISFEAIWALRKQHNGWRIAGMATQIESGQPPQFFNFEQPETLVQQIEQGESDLTAGSDAQGQIPQQAQRPAQPGSDTTLQR